MKNILKIAILSMVLVNCSSNDNNNIVPDNNNNPTTFEPQNIETEVMLKGFSEFESLYPSTDDYFVVQSQEELNQLINRVRPYKENAYLQTFDFNQYQLLVVFNLIPTTIKSIDVTSVTEYEDKIIAVVENLEPNYEGTITFPGISLFPVEIVKIPKIDKPVEFNTSSLWIP